MSRFGVQYLFCKTLIYCNTLIYHNIDIILHHVDILQYNHDRAENQSGLTPNN